MRAADDDVIASLPCLDAAPAHFQHCIGTGAYDLRGFTPQQRAAGARHSAQLLHVPGEI